MYIYLFNIFIIIQLQNNCFKAGIIKLVILPMYAVTEHRDTFLIIYLQKICSTYISSLIYNYYNNIYKYL